MRWWRWMQRAAIYIRKGLCESRPLLIPAVDPTPRQHLGLLARWTASRFRFPTRLSAGCQAQQHARFPLPQLHPAIDFFFDDLADDSDLISTVWKLRVCCLMPCQHSESTDALICRTTTRRQQKTSTYLC